MECQYIFSVVVTQRSFAVKVQFKVSAFREYMGNFALNTLYLITNTQCLLFLKSGFHLLTVFSLLTNSDF